MGYRRLGQIQVREDFGDVLRTIAGVAAVRAFDEAYPNTGLHDVKKLDLLLWQSR